MSTNITLEYGDTTLVIKNTGKISRRGSETFNALAAMFWEALIANGMDLSQEVNIALCKDGEEGKKVKKGIAIIIDEDGKINHVGYKPNSYAKKWWSAVKRARPKE